MSDYYRDDFYTERPKRRRLPDAILVTFCYNYQKVSSLMIKNAEPSKIPPKGIYIGNIEGRLIVEESETLSDYMVYNWNYSCEESETLSEYMYYNNCWNRLSIQESFKCCGSTPRRQSANCILNKNTSVTLFLQSKHVLLWHVCVDSIPTPNFVTPILE